MYKYEYFYKNKTTISQYLNIIKHKIARNASL